MMKDPSYCYKFYWLEAIVQLISEDRKEASYDEIINEMISNAWYSVLEFHVHLSGIWGDGEIKDSLEKAVLKLHKLSDLSSNASKVEINRCICYTHINLIFDILIRHGVEHSVYCDVIVKLDGGLFPLSQFKRCSRQRSQ